jgi:hypothetical protein
MVATIARNERYVLVNKKKKTRERNEKGYGRDNSTQV